MPAVWRSNGEQVRLVLYMAMVSVCSLILKMYLAKEFIYHSQPIIRQSAKYVFGITKRANKGNVIQALMHFHLKFILLACSRKISDLEYTHIDIYLYRKSGQDY